MVSASVALSAAFSVGPLAVLCAAGALPPGPVLPPTAAAPAALAPAASPPSAALPAALAPDPDFVTFTGPEGAFTVEVPEGWDVSATIDRSMGAGIERLRMASPDGAMLLLSPDAPLLQVWAPDPSLGLYEGAHLGVMRVQRYTPAAALARTLAAERAAALGCWGARVTEVEDEPGLAARARAATPLALLPRANHTALATVACEWKGAPHVAFVGVSTFDSGMLWGAATSVFVAPEPRRDEARAILDRFRRTYTPDMAWREREAGVWSGPHGPPGPGWHGPGGHPLGGHGPSGWSSPPPWTPASPPPDTGMDAFIDALTGTVDLRDRWGDPVYDHESTAAYHWQDGQGNIVGTELDENPDPLEYERIERLDGSDDW